MVKPIFSRLMPLTESHSLLAACILIAALLYSSVGHGGASGYLAAMALFGVAPAVMRPTALVLNLLVAAIATVQFCPGRDTSPGVSSGPSRPARFHLPSSAER